MKATLTKTGHGYFYTYNGVPFVIYDSAGLYQAVDADKRQVCCSASFREVITACVADAK